ncbi:MAG: glycosyltransferase family 2 protein, partial [Desulfurobacteriaceae bacterium]
MREKNTVCAVVVTYNRKNLLMECLDALRKQTRPVQAIYLIDNASTDGTPELLLEKGYIEKLPPKDLTEPWEKEFELKNLTDGQSIRFHYVRMHENTGGAGGFYEGVKRAYEKGYDWLWLMDDDTVSEKETLLKLQEKSSILNEKKIGFICSKVVWTDGTPHFMNLPSVKPIINGIPFNFYEDKEVLVVESASFVSLLVNRKVIERVGLPLREFFIWADDVEYTLRITKSGFLGLYVRDSIAIHKTKTNYSATTVYDWRFYYNVRNWLWIYRLHYRKKY